MDQKHTSVPGPDNIPLRMNAPLKTISSKEALEGAKGFVYVCCLDSLLSLYPPKSLASVQGRREGEMGRVVGFWPFWVIMK